LFWLFVCLYPPDQFSAIRLLSPLPATWLHLDLCLALIAFSSEVSYLCQYLRHGTSVYTVSSQGPAPTSHSWIRTGNARITRFMRLHSNHCTTRVATLFCFDIHSHTPRNAIQMRHTTIISRYIPVIREFLSFLFPHDKFIECNKIAQRLLAFQ
jgi:hypothetical protein